MTDTKYPECHEGEEAAERFTDALGAVFRAGRVSDVRAGVNRTPARERDPDRSTSGTSRGDRSREPAPA